MYTKPYKLAHRKIYKVKRQPRRSTKKNLTEMIPNNRKKKEKT